MAKAYPALSALFIILATVGLLLIPQFWDRKIKTTTEENTDAISKRKDIAELIEKANYYQDAAHITSDSMEILKALKVREDITQQRENRYVAYHRSSATYLVYALMASGQLDDREGNDLLLQVDNSMKLGDLRYFYDTQMGKAYVAMNVLRLRIDGNKAKICHLESIRNRLWGLCFAFQSLGMLFGLGALSMRR
jgi:hypothetical protein